MKYMMAVLPLRPPPVHQFDVDISYCVVVSPLELDLRVRVTQLTLTVKPGWLQITAAWHSHKATVVLILPGGRNPHKPSSRKLSYINHNLQCAETQKRT